MKITHCRINRMKNPLGFTLGTLRASWIVEDTRATTQKWAEIEVALDANFTEVVYDSGKKQLSSLAAVLPIELKARTRYYWRVTVEADNGEQAVSETNWFETAKEQENWIAEWITVPEQLQTENPVFEKTICTEQAREARLYLCGFGLYTAWLNGEKVGQEYLSPGCNDYNMWLQYQTYILPLQKGENTLRISLGNGWYKGRFGLGGAMSNYGHAFHLIAEVRDRDELLAATDASWQVHAGPIGENGIYDGETFSPAMESGDAIPACLDTEMKEALEKGIRILQARRSLPVVVHEERKPMELIHTPAGEWVLDFGQNMAGIVRMHVKAEKGVKVRLQFGEILQNGCFYRDNLRGARAEYVYVSDGQERTVEPQFTYYGFRYVKVEGMEKVCPENFTALVLYSDLEMTGHIRTSDAKLNQLISNCVWGQKSNYLEIPTDCPQRDERLGWTGDTQVFAGTACFSMDSFAFLSKQMYDVYMTQKELGCVTNTVPAFQDKEPTSCAWGDVATIVPWILYTYYGDAEILRQQFDSMKLWADYMYEKEQACGGHGLWETKTGFGDWLAMDHENPAERYAGGTDLTYLHTAYYYYSTTLVQKAAHVLGSAEEEMYAKRAERIRQAFLKHYYTPDGLLAVTTQTAYAVALYMGLYPDGGAQKIADLLADKINAAGGRIKTGFIGTPILCRVLSQYGYSALAYKLLFNEETPSWLYAVNLGATTVWERWNSVNPDGSVNGTDMNSMNHYAYGSILEWMYRHMAGIRPLEDTPGFKQVVIAPEVDMRLREVDMTYDSAAGMYRVAWKILDNRHLQLEVQVPFDAKATLYLPGSDCTEELSAGTHSFSYETDQPLWKILTVHDNFNELREYPPILPLLDKYIPMWKDLPRIFTDIPLTEMANDPYLPVNQETIARLEKELDAVNAPGN